jgi:hypothetical protein
MRVSNIKFGAVFLVAALSTLLPPIIRAQSNDDLFPIIQNGKIGYIDQTGKIVISPQFDVGFLNQSTLNVVRFSEGLAVVKVKGKWGYIDKTGAVVIKPVYTDAWPFSEGLAEVRVTDGRSGYIDKSGKMIVAPISNIGSNPFSEGLAAVYVGELNEGRWGFVDKTGAMAIEPRFEAAGPFSEGKAVVRIGPEYGAIDKEGNFAIPLQKTYVYGPPFKEGFAPAWTVAPAGSSESKADLIDTSGKIMFDFRFRGISPFSEGLAAVDVNIEGEVPTGVVPNPQKPQVGKRAAGYIDIGGTLVIEPKFDFATPFSEGLAAVGIGSIPSIKAGYIDKTGAVIIPPSFDLAFPFHDGLALVATGQRPNFKFGYVDKSGKYVWQEK